MINTIVIKSLGLLLLLLAAALLIPTAVSIYYADGGTGAFMLSALIAAGVGSALYWRFRDSRDALRTRDAVLLVGSSWVLMTIAGALPYYLSGTYPTIVDAWFESSAGFTTTGASVITDIEGLPHAVLLWRSLTQYLGGMGIIVLSLAILPLLGIGGMDLYKAEAPGPTGDKISARVSHTARALWIVYVAFTGIEALVLWLLGMTPFDAINHALTTMATGGFSTKNASIASFDSAAIEMAMTFFMFLAGVSFLLHYRLLVRRETSIFRDDELRFFSMVTLGSTLLIALGLWGSQYDSFLEALRFSVFQVVSIATTTGFATADYELWGSFARLLLILLMAMGGSAGSTAGGIKCVRAMMLIKQGYHELVKLLHPHAVVPLKRNGKIVPVHVSNAIFGYFFLYIALMAITSLLVTASGVDLVAAVSGTISALSNVGPGLAEVGPTLNYGGLPAVAKALLAACMIIGRLEIFTLLALFTSAFWRK